MKRFAAATIVAWCGLCLTAPARNAQELLEASGIKGGLVVHMGCGEGELTAALRAGRAGDRYLVHGLDTDPEKIARARKRLLEAGLYGPVSVDLFDGKSLPYADNLVNLLIVTSGEWQVPGGELERVLAPRGLLLAPRSLITDHPSPPGSGAAGRSLVTEVSGLEDWVKRVKPVPSEIDEWTHNLHDAGGNAVARDRTVGPPRRLQWTSGPLWARSHGYTPSVTAMVSSGGRLFAICDETLTCLDDSVPSKWFLVARDAFSGVLLWKNPLGPWGSAAFSGTPDTGHGITTGRFTMPTHAGKRLVAQGNRVYVTTGAEAPVSALDAATGELKRAYDGSERTDELLVSDGRLIVSTNPTRDKRPSPAAKEAPPPAPGKLVRAFDADSGRMLWQAGPYAGIRAGRGQDPFGRLELAAGDGKVFALTPETLEGLDAATGESAWRIDRPALPERAVRRLGFAGMFEFRLEVMVYHGGVVLLAQPEPNTHHTYHTMPGTLYAFDATSGRTMWKQPYGGWGHCTPPDIFVVDDTVWSHVDAETAYGNVWGDGYRAKDSSRVNYRIQALDLKSGKLRRELATRDLFNVGHHHRCYRNRITERFLLSSRRGVEFVDLASGQNHQNHWLRSGCLLGNLPCNGLLYVTPHPCGCYIEAKLTGFNALAPAAKATAGKPAEQRSEVGGQRSERLEKGPAYGSTNPQSAVRNPQSAVRNPQSEWPAYRHDKRRSGATEAAVPAELETAWRAEIGPPPSAPVIADDRLLVAASDAHTVHALNADDGGVLWTQTVGARVDSPPALHEGMAIFGAADGKVYCLRAADGALVWRFDAAPEERLVTVRDQLESTWPVHGSVAMQDGKCWFAAGRSSYLDGGIRVYALTPATGEIQHEKTFYSPNPDTGTMDPIADAQRMPGLLNDIPSCSGGNVFIRQMAVSPDAKGGAPHLYSSGGFLDASWFNRTFWKYGRAQTSGLMVLGDGVAYGMEVFASRSRETVFKPGSGAYRLRCLPLKQPAATKRSKPPKGRRNAGPKPLWEQRTGIRVTAMVRAAERIFVAGSPDSVDPADPHAAWEGRKGGLLAVYGAKDGRKLAGLELPAPPAWDGMAAAGQRLYLSLSDGSVLCLRGKGGEDDT
jgi:outer membrane protein assembly factor BamB